MICLLAATPHETALLRSQLPFQPDPRLPGQTLSCQFCAEEILLLHTGVGIASAAISLSRLLERTQAELLIAFGCGGSYPASGLRNGDLALARHELFGDLGAATPNGFVPLSDLGLPEVAAFPPLFRQDLALDPRWLHGAEQLLGQAGELQAARILAGGFVTVNRVSGTFELCASLAQRSGAICENMEGAALAQAAQAFGLPLIELRGISNPCGSRERADWDLPAGMQVAQAAVLRLLRELGPLRSLACA